MESMPGDESVVVHEGEKFLELLGFGDRADEWITRQDGTEIQARDFLDVCRDHAYLALVGFEAMDSSDPDYQETKTGLQEMVGIFLGEPPVAG